MRDALSGVAIDVSGKTGSVQRQLRQAAGQSVVLIMTKGESSSTGSRADEGSLHLYFVSALLISRVVMRVFIIFIIAPTGAVAALVPVAAVARQAWDEQCWRRYAIVVVIVATVVPMVLGANAERRARGRAWERARGRAREREREGARGRAREREREGARGRAWERESVGEH